MTVGTVSINELFSATYGECRDRFLSAARGLAAAPMTFRHPSKGPRGEELACDVVLAGDLATARRVIVLISSVHGVEGFAGSACQLALIHRLQQEAPAEIAFVLIHALNPFGMAYLRRECDANVDLNRNFVSHAAPYPQNADYLELHDVLRLQDIDGPRRRAADATLFGLLKEWGEARFINALAAGQYARPDGLFFGGTEADWSQQVLRAVCASLPPAHPDIVFVDIHTGVGVFSAATLLSFSDQRDAEFERALALVGDRLVAPLMGGAFPYRPTGTLPRACAAMVPHAQTTAITIEFGTYDGLQDLERHRQENWLWRTEGPLRRLDHPICQAHLQQSYPDDDTWRRAILTQFAQVVGSLVSLSQTQDTP